jgi:Putative carbonic anhydrase
VPPATFGTAINCIDGRTQLPLITWMRDAQSVQYVDLVTEPGADALLARDPAAALQLIRPRVLLSVEAHGSSVVAIAGHFQCAAG